MYRLQNERKQVVEDSTELWDKRNKEDQKAAQILLASSRSSSFP